MGIETFIAWTDHLADTWRWWASMGALLALPPSTRFWWAYVRHNVAEHEDLRTWTRIILGAGAIMLLLATLLMGAIIPWANDGRIEGFTRDSLLYRQSVAIGWLLWGGGCWATAIAFARHRLPMVLASILWWWAMLFTVRLTYGAFL